MNGNFNVCLKGMLPNLECSEQLGRSPPWRIVGLVTVCLSTNGCQDDDLRSCLVFISYHDVRNKNVRFSFNVSPHYTRPIVNMYYDRYTQASQHS